MKFLAVGFLFALFLGIALGMTLNAPIAGFKPGDSGPSCHGGHGGHRPRPGSNSTDGTTPAATTASA